MAENEMIAENIQAVRGEFRYFAIYDTEFGAIEVTFTRSDDEAKNHNPDAAFRARWFRPDRSSDYAWRYVAALNHSEIEGRDVPKHADDPAKYLELLREDGERLLGRTLAILRSDARRQANG